MSKPTLTAERLRKLFYYDPNTGFFTRFVSTKGKGARAGIVAGSKDSEGYLRITIDRSSYKVHRLAWLAVHGAFPAGHIDHIDGNPANNRIENLRDVSHSINQQNKRKAQANNKLGLLGVRRHQNGFMATITLDCKQRYLGTYKTPELAHAAYLEAKRQLHQGCTI